MDGAPQVIGAMYWLRFGIRKELGGLLCSPITRMRRLPGTATARSSVANCVAELSISHVMIFLHAIGLFCAAASGFMCTIRVRRKTLNSNEQKLMKYSRAFQRQSNTY